MLTGTITMRMLPSCGLVRIWGIVLLVVAGLALQAEVRTFVIDQEASTVSVAGSVSGVQGQPQGPGSMTTRFTGTIVADVGASTIQFVGGSVIEMLDSGDWQPAPGGVAGSAPANLAGMAQNFLATAKGALREMELEVTSPLLSVGGQGIFEGEELVWAFPADAASAVDYLVTGLLAQSGTEALAGISTNGIIDSGTVVQEGAEWVLTIPLDFTGTATLISENDVSYSVTGQILARAGGSAVLRVSDFQVEAGRLNFSLATRPGRAYTVLGSTDLVDWTTVVHQFIAESEAEAVEIAVGLLPGQFFRIREEP